eukprot:715683-Prorocentrum_minimum.AAC.1
MAGVRVWRAQGVRVWRAGARVWRAGVRVWRAGEHHEGDGGEVDAVGDIPHSPHALRSGLRELVHLRHHRPSR